MTFYEEMRAEVLRHGAINNPYLDRFETGALTDEEVRLFAVEFYNFARFFPKILVAQLVNTEDEAVADELTQVLYSELGDLDAELRLRHLQPTPDKVGIRLGDSKLFRQGVITRETIAVLHLLDVPRNLGHARLSSSWMALHARTFTL